MINLSAISEALRAQLQNDAGVAAMIKNPIRRGDYVNNDPQQCPWVGVYRAKTVLDPRTLGRGARNWQGRVQINVMVQDFSLDSGQDCEDKLEQDVQTVMDAILSDYKISNTVDMLVNVEVNYTYNETERESLFYQNAVITLEYEVATS